MGYLIKTEDGILRCPSQLDLQVAWNGGMVGQDDLIREESEDGWIPAKDCRLIHKKASDLQKDGFSWWRSLWVPLIAALALFLILHGLKIHRLNQAIAGGILAFGAASLSLHRLTRNRSR